MSQIDMFSQSQSMASTHLAAASVPAAERPGIAPTFPRAKSSDPRSSHEAAAEMERSGRDKAQTEAVLAALKRHDGATTAELALWSGMDLYAVRRRMTELASGKDGRVHQEKPTDDIEPCEVSGKRVCRWWVA